MRSALVVCCAASLGLWVLALAARSRGDEPAYPLDALPRTLPEGAPLPCEKRAPDLVEYRGTHLRYQRPLRVHPAFRAQLGSFERLAKTIAIEHFGRAPARVVHLGSYNCRRMRRYPDWVSEHALGNALDLVGFDFGPLAASERQRSHLPRALQRAFSVRVLEHWDGRRGALQQRFLHTLAEALIARPDLFHGVLGPAWPGHKNHLHLDRAPYRVVEVF